MWEKVNEKSPKSARYIHIRKPLSIVKVAVTLYLINRSVKYDQDFN